MKPERFREANLKLTAPSGMTTPCTDLWIHTDGTVAVSRWRMTWKERITALLHGRVWLWVISGETQPPVALEARWDVFKCRDIGGER